MIEIIKLDLTTRGRISKGTARLLLVAVENDGEATIKNLIVGGIDVAALIDGLDYPLLKQKLRTAWQSHRPVVVPERYQPMHQAPIIRN